MTALAFSPSGVLYVATGDGGIFRINDGAKSRDKAAAGRQIYRQHCASCHGAKLEGQPNWRVRKPNGRLPAPPHDETGHTWHHTDDVLFGITKKGIAGFASPGYESDMPAYKDILTDEQIWAVLAFIKSRWSEEIQARHKARGAGNGG